MWEPGILRTVSNIPFFLRGCFRGCQLLPQHPCLAGWEFASGRAAADSQEHTRVLQSPSGNLAGAGMAPEQQRPETLQSQVVTEPCRAIPASPTAPPSPTGSWETGMLLPALPWAHHSQFNWDCSRSSGPALLGFFGKWEVCDSDPGRGAAEGLPERSGEYGKVEHMEKGRAGFDPGGVLWRRTGNGGGSQRGEGAQMSFDLALKHHKTYLGLGDQNIPAAPGFPG